MDERREERDARHVKKGGFSGGAGVKSVDIIGNEENRRKLNIGAHKDKTQTMRH